MNRFLSRQQIQKLSKIDTPTISDAIEQFNLRCRTEGFMGMEIRYLFPQLGVMFGHAVTAKVDTTTPDMKKEKRVPELLEAIEKSPKPVVVVLKVKGPKPKHTCAIGEVMAMAMKRVGAVGVVTDGGVRDLQGLRKIRIKIFSSGTVASHGILSIEEINSTVEISGVEIKKGDLLHGDENGIVKIPRECVDRLYVEIQSLLAREKQIKNAINSPGFSAIDMRRIYVIRNKNKER